jgi:hypothetical protein
VSRRWRYPRSRRGLIYPVPRGQQSPARPHFRDQPKSRVRAVTVRRGRFFPLVPVTVVPPPRPPDRIGRDRPWTPRTARGRFFAAPQPDLIPPSYRIRDRFTARSRRGAVFTVVPLPVPPLRPPDRAARRRPWISRRPSGIFLAITPPPGAPPLYGTRDRAAAVRPRRGSFFTLLPPAPVVPATPRPPDRIARDRLVTVRAARGRFLPVPLPQIVLPPVHPPDSIGHDRPRPPVVRRGRIQTPAIAPSAPARTAGTRRPVALTARRGQFFTIAAAPPIVAPPRPPDRIERPAPRPLTARRTRFAAPPSPTAGYIPAIASHRPAARTVRRGTFLAIVGAAMQRPALARPRAQQPIVIRRGRFHAVPPAPVPVTLPPPPDRPGRLRTRPITARRGRFTPVPLAKPVGAQPWIPPLLSTRRPMPRPVRHGRFASCPPPHERPVTHLRRRPSSPPALRRTHRADPPWTTPRPPDRITGRRCSIPALPRRRGATPPRPPAAPPPGTAFRQQARTRPTTTRRGCFWSWSIFQAIHQPVPLPDHLSAVEALTGEHTSAETASLHTGAETVATLIAAEARTGTLDSQEHVTGDRTATEIPIGTMTAAETPFTDSGT